MRIGFFLSSHGGSPLQVGLMRGLEALGHQKEEHRHARGYDLILVFNQTAHVNFYHYPPWPMENVPIAFIDSAEYGYFRRLPHVIWGYYNTFAPCALTHDTKNEFQQRRLRAYLEGKSFPYFMREFHEAIPWPETYHPIDYPLYALSHCATTPNRAAYMRRDLDLFVAWGGSHPWRIPITQALRDAHTKCEINLIGYDRAEKIPQPEYFSRMEAAKCSVSYDGYGSSSFRMTEILVRTVLLLGPLTMQMREPLTDGVNCVAYGVDSIGEDFIRTDAGKKVHEVLADPERAYRIYEAGYDHCMTHYTEKATAAYVMRVIEAHDWSKPTPLDITREKE